MFSFTRFAIFATILFFGTDFARSSTAYLFYQGPSSQLHFTEGSILSTGGINWGNDTLVNAHDLSFGPSTVVYNGLIYVFSQGIGNNGQLWYNKYNPSTGTWAGAVLIPLIHEAISAGPTVIISEDNWIYIYYTAADGSIIFVESQDGVSYFETAIFGPGTASSTPNTIYYNGTQYLFFQSYSNPGYAYYSKFIASESLWTAPSPIGAGVGITQGPQSIVVGGILYVFHQGASQLWYTTFNGTNWGNDKQITYLIQPIASNSGPAPAYINGFIYSFYVGANGLVYFSAITPSGGEGPVDQVYPIASATAQPSVIIY